MKNPVLVTCLMLVVGASVIGVVVFLGDRSTPNPLDPIAGLEKQAPVIIHDLKASASKTLTDLPVPSENGPWPKAVYKETSYHFGRMAINAPNEYRFTIRNEGEADLILKEGKPTCKCTTFALVSRVVKPGEETALDIHWHGGPNPDRSFRHGGLVHTNDPKSPAINYTVEGAIDVPVELLPATWNVGNISREQAGTFKAAIATRLYDQFEVESIVSPSGKVNTKISPMSIEDLATEKWLKGFQIEIEVAADIPPGRFEEMLTVNITGVSDVQSVPVKLLARKYGSFILQPYQGALYVPDKSLLQLGQFPATEGRSAKLLLIVDQKDMNEPFQLMEIESDPPFLKASMEPLGGPTGTIHRYIVEITVPPGRPHTQKTDTNRGHITIHTNHPTKESIQTDILMFSH